MLIHTGGGGTPSQVQGGTPSQVWGEGVPPYLDFGQGTPRPDLGWGTPLPRLGTGYPPVDRHTDRCQNITLLRTRVVTIQSFKAQIHTCLDLNLSVKKPQSSSSNPLDSPMKLNIMKLSLFQVKYSALNLFLLACSYAVSHSGSLHTYEQTQKATMDLFLSLVICM